jgi:nucleotidyltransferase substrate binding protein (TIGR01987 family)
MIDYSKLQKSLSHLELQYANYLSSQSRSALSDLDKEAIAESCIQRFEVCYDCAWKVLKRYLIEILGIPDVPNSPKPVFRLANENKLFSGSIEDWLRYADVRTNTAHDYDGDKALLCIKELRGFIDETRSLLTTMSGELQT